MKTRTQATQKKEPSGELNLLVQRLRIPDSVVLLYRERFARDASVDAARRRLRDELADGTLHMGVRSSWEYGRITVGQRFQLVVAGTAHGLIATRLYPWPQTPNLKN